MVAFGIALGLMNWSFYGSLAHLPLGVAVTIEFLGPLVLTTVLSRKPADFAAVMAAGFGVLLISEALRVPLRRAQLGGHAARGDGGCLLGGLHPAERAHRSGFPQLDGLAIALVVSTLVVTPVGLIQGFPLTPEYLLKGLALAVLSSLLPYSLELLALRRLSATVFGILLSLEPAVAALAGFLVLDQRLHPLQVVGIGLVVLASAMIMGLGSRSERKEPANPGQLDPA